MLLSPSHRLRSIPTSPRALVFFSLILLSSAVVSADNIASTPVPPLQWINLTGLLSGPAPPPLKDASIGYDETSRTLLIFGGESSQSFPQANTYLLDLDTLQWSTPSTLPNLSGIKPPPRSAAISGEDSAASYRRSHIVIGGKGADGSPLNDIWEFDYQNQFWSQVQVVGSQPPPRWGAAGGKDLRSPSIQDVTIASPNNSYFLAGGFNGKAPIPLSDIWRFNVTGTLSSNNVNQLVGSWEQIGLPTSSTAGLRTAVPVDLAGTIVWQGNQQHIAAVGGCNATTSADASCAEGNSFIINVDAGTNISPPPCPAPRIGGALAPNMNTFSQSQSFQSQMFLLLGVFNTSLWNDDNGLNQGEVGVLDVNGGGWARVLPSGDPGTSGKPSFPTPREGAAVFSYSQALVGASRSSASDIIVFGGKDVTGQYLSELWILRAYNDVIDQSGAHWAGYGDGKLTTGTNATGAGVTIQYMTTCASQIAAIPSPSNTVPIGGGPTSTSSSGQPQATNTQGTTTGTVTNSYDTSTTHKVLAPISLALIFPALVLYRLSLPSLSSVNSGETHTGYFYLGGVLALGAWGTGIGGLATAFTSITHNSASSIAKRATSSVPVLTTNHGRAGLALFVGLYGLIPLLIAIAILVKPKNGSVSGTRARRSSNELAEKMALYQNRGPSPVVRPADSPQLAERQADHRSRVRSWGSSLGRFSFGHARRSSESAVDEITPPSTGSFEVTNRPARTRHVSAHSFAAFSDPRPSLSPRNLSDMSWLERRRSPGAAAELDYALTHLNHRPQYPPTPGTAALDMQSTRGLVHSAVPVHPVMPSVLESLMHILLHAFLIALSVVALIALHSRAPIATFAVFLAWVACFYLLIFAFAWCGIPRESILSVVFFRLRSSPPPPGQPGTSTPHPPSSVGLDAIPFPGEHGVYQNQPPYRPAHDSEYPTSLSHVGHTINDDPEDDEDDDTRQQRIEEEMSRRNVSIVTTLKRPLVVVNKDRLDNP